MRYLRVKVKNLILAAAVFAIIYVAIPFTYSKLAQSYNNKGEDEKAAGYYEKALSLTPDILKSGKDIYDYANILSGSAAECSLYNIFPYGSGGSGSKKVPTDEDINKAINLYKDLIENYSSDPWAKWGYIRLTEIYMYKGDYEEAEKYLNAGKNRADAGLIYTLYNTTGEYQKGINMLEDLIKNNKNYFDMNYFDGLAQLYINSGRYDEAINNYKSAMARINEMKEENPEEKYYIDKTEELNIKLKKTEELKNDSHETGEFRGRVKVDGIGIEGVKVYIKDKEIYKEDYISGSFEFPFITTDKDGYYSIDNVLHGEYDIGIGIRPDEIMGKAYIDNRDSQRILEPRGVLINNFEFNKPIEILAPNDGIKVSEDKLEISWEKFDGTDSYSLVAGLIFEGSYGSSVFMDKIKECKAVIDIKKITPEFMGHSSFSGEDGKPTSGTLLGVYGEGKVLYGIQAYDRNGRLIGSSMPIIKAAKLPRHFVMVTQKLEGDDLIKAEQYEKARDWFIDYLSNNPEDVHSLYVLARYYEYCEKDYEKAKEYLNRLYGVTKDEEYKKHMERISDK